MNYRLLIGALVVALLAGYSVGRYFQPAEIKTEIKEVEKVVEKIKKDIVVVEREVKNPDGTVVIDRRTEDKSEEAVSRDTKREEKQEVSKKLPDWKVNALAKSSLSNIAPQYGALLERRILGPVWVGVGGFQDGTATLSVGFEF